MTYTLHTGDCRDVMATLPAESVDAIVCDPPYGLSFMGKGWDHGVPGVDFWVEALRVLKPGGHLIAFGGTRTYHRLAVAIEDAGFEVRDCLMWLYGSGFPKSLDVSKAMDKQAGIWRGRAGSAHDDDTRRSFGQHYERTDKGAPATDLAKQWHGWGTALKPAYEPAILARKPLRGTVADNVAQWSTGGLNIDGCRLATDDNLNGGSYGNTSRENDQYFNGKKPGGAGQFVQPSGRWPANVILDEEAAAALDAQSGVMKASHRVGKRASNQGKTFGLYTGQHEALKDYADSGGASRFFYTAKASRSEREAGLEGMEAKPISSAKNGGNMIASDWINDPRHPDGGYKAAVTEPRANHHPTVKPIALMRYMIRLVAPRGAVVLDPFMGSGSTGCAAMVEGMQFIGIDITPEYVDIARRRIAWWSASSPLDNTATIKLHEEERES